MKQCTRIKHLTLTVALAVIMLGLFLSSICIGRYSIPVEDVVKVILGKTDGVPSTVISIVGNSRIPRAAAAVLVGMALSSAGVSYQSVFTNPLAAPDILGAASGSAFGAALGILLSNSNFLIQIMAFCFGLAAVSLTMLVSRVVGKGKSTVVYLILVGMVVTALFKSGIAIIKYFADIESTLPAITFWLMGGLTKVTREQVLFVAPIISVCLIILFIIRWRLNLLSFGDEEATSMGINVNATRAVIIVLSTLMSAAAISTCGLIGWVGIAMPHCARMIVGANNKILLPVAALMGGIFVLIIDLIGRMLLMVEIPLGILTALVGAPVFLYIMFKGNFLGGGDE